VTIRSSPNLSSDCVRVDEQIIRALIAKSREIILDQPMLLELAAPLKIAGDTHG